jgi:hypothetical protein
MNLINGKKKKKPKPRCAMNSTEDLKRLIKDSEIVGYEYKFYNPNTLTIETCRFKDFDPAIRVRYWTGQEEFESLFKHDSFNLSFKLGDRWILEGDRVNFDYEDSLSWSPNHTGFIKFEDWTFVIMEDKNTGCPIEYAKNIAVTSNIYTTEASHENR